MLCMLCCCMVLFLLPYSSSHGPLRPPTSRPHHASGPLTHSSRSRPHAATPVTCPAHVPPKGPPPMLYTTGPAHTWRSTSRRTRPLTRSRSRSTRLRSRPLPGPARTRTSRRSHNPRCPLTTAHGSPLATPPAHSPTLKPSRFTHGQPGPTRTGYTTKGPPSPLYLARVRSLLAIPRFL